MCIYSQNTTVFISIILAIYYIRHSYMFRPVVRIVQSVKRLNYWLDGLGSNPGGDKIFRPSTPALGPTQPPVKWVPDLSRG